MPYYHVYVLYTDKNGEQWDVIRFGISDVIVGERIANPYMKNKPLFFGGRIIHPSKIDEIAIFRSNESLAKNIILPNGKSAIDESNVKYVVECFRKFLVAGVGVCTDDFITSPPKEEPKVPELTTVLMESATFLGLDTNWSSATCALQLQEVAVTLVAKKKNINLNKANVEKILNKKIKELTFNDRYNAFSKQVKASFKIDMPRLTTHLRRMRTEVLHQGYNPTPEETESITNFTIGLLKKLKDIS